MDGIFLILAVMAILTLVLGLLLVYNTIDAVLTHKLIRIYTPTGALYWFVIVTILSVMASWLPARGATRVSVQERSLVYQ